MPKWQPTVKRYETKSDLPSAVPLLDESMRSYELLQGNNLPVLEGMTAKW